MAKLTQYPRNKDGTPMTVVVGMLTDINGNAGVRLTNQPLAPDGSPIDAVALLLVDSTGTPLNVSGGAIAGASAYERAVANGFVGTETQWLDSLKSNVPGPPGAPGVSIGALPPGDTDTLWLDTNTSPATLKYWTGTTWSAVAGGGTVGGGGDDGGGSTGGTPGFLGTVRLGQTIYADTDGSAYQWYADGVALPDEVSDHIYLDEPLLGAVLYYEVTPTGGGSVLTSSNTIAVPDITLTTAPILTRISASGAQPFNFSSSVSSQVLPGYFERLIIASDENYATIKYEGLLEITSAMIAAGVITTADFANAVPPIDQTGWPAHVQARARFETATAEGLSNDYASDFSNDLQSQDVAWPFVAVWNAATGFTRSNGNLTATHNGTTDQKIIGNKGIDTAAAGDFDKWIDFYEGGSGNCAIGLSNLTESGYLGGSNNSIAAHHGANAVLKNGATLFSFSIGYPYGYRWRVKKVSGVVSAYLAIYNNGTSSWDYQNGANPSTNTGGIVITGIGTVYPVFQSWTDGKNLTIDYTNA